MVAIHSYSRLQDKVESSWHRASNHRVARERIFKAYLGDTHGLSESGSNFVPLNGHAAYARSLMNFLAAHQPKLMISTDVGPWKPDMESVSFQASRVMKEQRFGFRQQRWVLDALLYSPGILSVYQTYKAVPQEGTYTSALTTCVKNVDFSDWVFDTSASSVWDLGFAGCRVAMNVDDILANPIFEGISEEQLRGMSGAQQGDTERLFFENDDKSQQYRDIVMFYEAWEPDKQQMCFWPVDAPNLKREVPWKGHPDGPYHYLDFLDVPNHVCGLSPMCMLYNLFDATNRALNKSIRQTEIAKNILRITGGSKPEAEAIMEALDGQAVYQNSGGLFDIVPVGGPDQKTIAMVPILKDLANWLGGNVDVSAGLSTGGADTATQGRMLNEASQGMVNFLQSRTKEAVRHACEAIVHCELADTVTTEVIPETLADGQTYWKKFTPEQRNRIDMLLLNIDIDVYSMQYKSPQDRLMAVMNWWNNVAMPGYQMAAAQGMEYDIQMLNKHYAKLIDEPIISDIALYSMQPMPEATGSAPMEIKQSPNTTRTSVRMDRGGKSQELGGGLAASLLSSAA